MADERNRLLIAVLPNDQARQLVRVGKRFANALHAEWLTVSVETPDLLKLPESARNQRVEVLRLAESLGAETVTLSGTSAADTLVEYARLRNITHIVVGESTRSGWRRWLGRATTADLVRRGIGFDISVIARREGFTAKERDFPSSGPKEIPWAQYALALVTCAACTGVDALIFPYFELTNLIMVYLIGATLAALRLGRGPAILAALVNIALFDFCFVPPRFSFAVGNFQYLVTFSVMLGLTMLIATLVASVRAQTRVAGARERRTSLLYAMSRELAANRDLDTLSTVAIKHVAESFTSRATVLIPDKDGALQARYSPDIPASLDDVDLAVAQWVLDHGEPAGLGTETLPTSLIQYLPLTGTRQTLGVLAVMPRQRRRLLLPEQRHLLETFAGQIGLALERAQLAEDAERAHVAAETESVRNTLLASISHDMRTPLAVIAGASSALNNRQLELTPDARSTLTQSIEKKAQEMSELISNVLDLMRLESGEMHARPDWQMLDDLLGAAIARLDPQQMEGRIDIALPADLPPVYADAALVTQVFVNLLENAIKHTGPDTHITVSAASGGREVQVFVDDDGPGLPAGDPERLFSKFQRGREESNISGAGLGLAICRAIVKTYGGHISAMARVGGGARFVFTLPTAEPAP